MLSTSWYPSSQTKCDRVLNLTSAILIDIISAIHVRGQRDELKKRLRNLHERRKCLVKDHRSLLNKFRTFSKFFVKQPKDVEKMIENACASRKGTNILKSIYDDHHMLLSVEDAIRQTEQRLEKATVRSTMEDIYLYRVFNIYIYIYICSIFFLSEIGFPNRPTALNKVSSVIKKLTMTVVKNTLVFVMLFSCCRSQNKSERSP